MIDFNADLGESFGLWERGADEALMRVISSANVACGFHAGDPGAMRRAVAQARANGVHVGAHPGLPDLLGFGRRVMDVAADDVRDYVLYQVAALDGFAHGLHHVKPHGALYMMALDDAAIARAVAEAVASYQEGLPVYTLAGSELWHAAAAAGLPAVAEFFADRPLRADGSVVMFGWQEAVRPDAGGGRRARSQPAGDRHGAGARRDAGGGDGEHRVRPFRHAAGGRARRGGARGDRGGGAIRGGAREWRRS